MTDTVQQARLRALLEAEKKVLKSQEWQDGTIKNRRADYQQKPCISPDLPGRSALFCWIERVAIWERKSISIARWHVCRR